VVVRPDGRVREDRESRLAVPKQRDQSLGMPLAGGVDAAPEKVLIAPLAVSSVVSTGPSVVRLPVASTVTICTPVKPLWSLDEYA